jgi:hypothetical protein
MAKGIINQSDELRKLLIQQAEKYNIPFMHICNHVGIQYKEFLKGYANIKNIRKDQAVDIPDYKLVEMAKLVGLDVRMVLVIRDDKTFAQEALQIRKKLKDEYDDSKEKGASSEA